MKLLKNIFGRIWAVWGLIVFATTLLIVVIPICLTYLIPEPYGVRCFAFISRIWMIVFLYAVGCPFRFYGKENFKKGKNYVVVANHNSFLDVPLLTPFLPGGNKTIAKKSMAKIPLFGWIYTRGSVLVDRGSDASRRRSFEGMKAVLQTGLHMLIYPEGTRNRTGEPLKSFYDGAFKLAVDTQKDIIPVCLFGTAKALPTNKAFFLWPTFFRIYILPPIAVQGKTATSLKQESFDAMWNFIKRKNGK
jgi:1-acyl-sn-glycerol-3-phosphate acyltransferase